MAATSDQDDSDVCVIMDGRQEMTTKKLTSSHDNTDDSNTDDSDSRDEQDGRDSWSKKREYILTVLGYIVGVGNIWRFPYMCNRNGGGAFLIPFMSFLLVAALPLFFMETALGQFTSRGPVHVWSVCPLFKGAGISVTILSFIVTWYFNIILAWAVYYLVSSFSTVVPWSRCDGWWNTDKCIDFKRHANVTSATNASSVLYNVTMASLNDTSLPMSDIFNSSDVGGNSTGPRPKVVTAAEEFYQHNVLQMSDSLYETGHVVWYLVLALLAVTVFIFLALIKGIKSSGKVVYVTATAPYLLLTVLLIRGALLPGAGQGVLHYITPDFNRLADPQVWIEAALQVFYSLGPGWGGLITTASYNKFSNNCLRDSVFLSLMGEGTSIFGGFAIFSVLGYMSHMSGLPIEKVVSSGPGLAFIVYPEAISLMPLPQLWAVLFFLMICTLVIDSQLIMTETVLTVITDSFPRIFARRRIVLTAGCCVVVGLMNLGLATRGGIYVFQLVDWYMAAYTVTAVALIECMVMAWLYGTDRFGDDICMMIGRKPPMIIRVLWCFVIPFILLVLLVFTLATYKAPTLGDYHYDVAANVVGWMIASVSFLPIPVVAVYQLWTASGTITQRLYKTTRPNEHWGPADPEKRRIYQKEVTQRPKRRNWLDVIR